MLSLEDVSLSFGGIKALCNVGFQVDAGQIRGLIGPNGAGKTTVFNIITGVYRPDAGQIRFHEHSLYNKRPSEIAAHGITRTFQNIRLFKDLSVLANVQVAFHLRHKYGFFDSLLRTERFFKEERENEENALKLLSLFGLQARAEELACNLPYGEQRKLEIVRALATEPSVLLLDEPAAGMNNQETASLMEMIRKVRDEFSLAILLIEHDMKLVMTISDEITVLDHGIVIAQGKPTDVQKDPKVIEAYLGGEDTLV